MFSVASGKLFIDSSRISSSATCAVLELPSSKAVSYLVQLLRGVAESWLCLLSNAKLLLTLLSLLSKRLIEMAPPSSFCTCSRLLTSREWSDLAYWGTNWMLDC